MHKRTTIMVITGGAARRINSERSEKEIQEANVKGRISIISELRKNRMAKPYLASLSVEAPVIDTYDRKTKNWLLKSLMVQSFRDMVHMAEAMKAHGVKPEV